MKIAFSQSNVNSSVNFDVKIERDERWISEFRPFEPVSNNASSYDIRRIARFARVHSYWLPLANSLGENGPIQYYITHKHALRILEIINRAERDEK